MNLVSFFPQADKLRNFMLDVEKHFEPMSYVAQSMLNATSYPPHNIYKTGEGKYTIEMAVAGFGKDELSVEVEPNLLTVKGNAPAGTQEVPFNYTYKGIASRNFTRVFYLSDLMKITNVSLTNGLLVIEIEKVIPEESKPKKIEITVQ